MSELDDRLASDRHARDASKRLLEADVDFIRRDVKKRGIASRLAESASESSRALARDAAGIAEANKGAVGGGLAAVAGLVGLWLFGDRIFGGRPEQSKPSEDAADEV